MSDRIPSCPTLTGSVETCRESKCRGDGNFGVGLPVLQIGATPDSFPRFPPRKRTGHRSVYTDYPHFLRIFNRDAVVPKQQSQRRIIRGGGGRDKAKPSDTKLFESCSRRWGSGAQARCAVPWLGSARDISDHELASRQGQMASGVHGHETNNLRPR